ncbi:MAG TPA: hypothetical protein VH539_12155 [Gemmatimonadaceae bacterium]
MTSPTSPPNDSTTRRRTVSIRARQRLRSARITPADIQHAQATFRALAPRAWRTLLDARPRNG